MSSTVSTTVVQPLIQAKTRAVKALAPTSSTPTSISKPQPAQPPGTWQHPKLREIAKRQAAAQFGERDVRVAVANAGMLLLSLYFRSWLHIGLSYATSPVNTIYPSTSIATYALGLIRLYILLNIALTLRPLSPYFRKTDDITDIPLTPSQRSLLGLPDSPAAGTPATSTPATGSPVSSPYITPPRYRRSSGSFTSSPASNTPGSGRSISANYASSPLSASRGFGSQSTLRSLQRTSSGSPFSPSASPLLHKAIGRGMDRELQEFNASTSGSNLGLSRSQSVKERGVRNGVEPHTPSPVTFGGVKRDLGLNYKWMYQTGRMPKSESMNF